MLTHSRSVFPIIVKPVNLFSNQVNLLVSNDEKHWSLMES